MIPICRVDLPASEAAQELFDGLTFDAGVGGCAVYVLRAGPSTKIGISDNPAARARGIQTGNDCEINIFWAVRFASRKDAQLIEREAHKILKLRGSHKRGEWFTIDPEGAVEIICHQIKRLGVRCRRDMRFGYSDLAS